MIKERFTDFLLDSIKHNWDINAFSDYGSEESLTYGEVGSYVVGMHERFKKMGIHKGVRIALCGINSSNWALTYISVVTYGAVIVPILIDFANDDIVSILADSGSKYLFADNSLYSRISQNDLSNIEAIFSLSDFSVLNSNKKNIDLSLSSFNIITKDDFKVEPIENDVLASLIYTSGTTGFSKGVMISHNALASNVLFARDNLPIDSGDAMISFLPLAHVFGCLFDFLFPFSRGVYIRFLTQLPSPLILMEALAAVRPHLILMVPLILEKLYLKKVIPMIEKPIMKILLKTPIISSVIKKKICTKLSDAFGGRFHSIIIGGSALNENAEKFFQSINFRLTVGYGMTECAPLISYMPHNEHILRGCGRAVDNVEVKIDSKDQENIAGEIIVRGENVMMGYYKNPKATAEALDKNGWLKTGDMGVIKDGVIFIRGRSKNMLLGSAGQNIYPEEIESRLNAIPYILESLIVKRDEKLHALIFPDMEKVKAENISNDSLLKKIEESRRTVNQVLPNFANISSVSIIEEEFEKNPTKKIKRFLYS